MHRYQHGYHHRYHASLPQATVTPGPAQFCYYEHGNCVQSTQSGMQSMPNLGGSGGPPENFEKLNPPAEIESEGIFNGLLSILLQDCTLHNNQNIAT